MADLCRAEHRKNTFNPSSLGSAQTAHDSLYTFFFLNLQFVKFLFLMHIFEKHNYINTVFLSVDM